MGNTNNNQEDTIDSYDYGECADTAFTMSAVINEFNPTFANIKLKNGKPTLDQQYQHHDQEKVLTGNFSGLLDLINYLEFESPNLGYSPGRLPSELSYCLYDRREAFRYPDNGPAIIVFEVYGVEGTHYDIWLKLCKIDPTLISVGYIVAPAPTSYIKDQSTGLQLSGQDGYRFYCLAENARSILRYGQLFSMRLWVHGLSGVRQIAPGRYEIREYVNAEAFSPDYILSEAPASLDEGLVQVRTPIDFSSGGLLNTKSFPYLNHHEKSMLVNNCAQAIARCPLSENAANVERLARAIWRGVQHDAHATVIDLICSSNSKEFPANTREERKDLVNACAQKIADRPLSFEAANIERLAMAIWKGVHHDAQQINCPQEEGDCHE